MPPTIPGQAGGRAVYVKYGSAYMAEIGRRGGQATAAKFRANVVATLTEIIGKIAEQARDNANWSSTIPDAIKAGQVEEVSGNYYGSITIDLNIAPEARAFEYGSGIHATKGERKLIPIPKIVTDKNLVFWWENAGKWFVGPKLPFGHPGVAPNPYIRPAIDQYKGEMRERLRTAFKKAFVNIGVTEIRVGD